MGYDRNYFLKEMDNKFKGIEDLLKSFDNDIKQQGISELSALLSERNFPSDQMEATIINLVIQCTMLKDQKPQSGIGQLEQKALECIGKIVSLKLNPRSYLTIVDFFLKAFNYTQELSRFIGAEGLKIYVINCHPVGERYVVQNIYNEMVNSISIEGRQKYSLQVLFEITSRFGKFIDNKDNKLSDKVIDIVIKDTQNLKSIGYKVLNKLFIYMNENQVEKTTKDLINKIRKPESEKTLLISLTLLANLTTATKTKIIPYSSLVLPVFKEFIPKMNVDFEKDEVCSLLIGALNSLVKYSQHSDAIKYVDEIFDILLNAIKYDTAFAEEKEGEEEEDDDDEDEEVKKNDAVTKITDLPLITSDDEFEEELEMNNEPDEMDEDAHDYSWRVRKAGLDLFEFIVKKEYLPLPAVYNKLFPSLLLVLKKEHTKETLLQLIGLIITIINFTEEYKDSLDNDCSNLLQNNLPSLLHVIFKRDSCNSVEVLAHLFAIIKSLSFIIISMHGLPLNLRVAVIRECYIQLQKEMGEELPTNDKASLALLHENLVAVMKMMIKSHTPIQLNSVMLSIVNFFRSFSDIEDEDFVCSCFGLIGKLARYCAPHHNVKVVNSEEEEKYCKDIYSHLTFSVYIEELTDLCEQSLNKKDSSLKLRENALISLGQLVSYWSVSDSTVTALSNRNLYLTREKVINIIDIIRDYLKLEGQRTAGVKALNFILSPYSLAVRLNLIQSIKPEAINDIAIGCIQCARKEKNEVSVVGLNGLLCLFRIPSCVRSLSTATLADIGDAFFVILNQKNQLLISLVLRDATYLYRAEEEYKQCLGDKGSEGVKEHISKPLDRVLNDIILSPYTTVDVWEFICRLYLARVAAGEKLTDIIESLISMYNNNRIPDTCWKIISNCLAHLLLNLSKEESKPFIHKLFTLLEHSSSTPSSSSSPPGGAPFTAPSPPPTFSLATGSASASSSSSSSSSEFPPRPGFPSPPHGTHLGHTPPPSYQPRHSMSPPPPNPFSAIPQENYPPLPHSVFSLFVFGSMGQLCDVNEYAPGLEKKLLAIITGEENPAGNRNEADFIRTCAAECYGDMAVGCPDKYAAQILKNASTVGPDQITWLMAVSKFLTGISEEHSYYSDKGYLTIEGGGEANGEAVTKISGSIQKAVIENIEKFFGILSSVLVSDNYDVRNAAILSISRLLVVNPERIMTQLVELVDPQKDKDVPALTKVGAITALCIAVTKVGRSTTQEENVFYSDNIEKKGSQLSSTKKQFEELLAKNIGVFFNLASNNNNDVKREACLFYSYCCQYEPSICRTSVRRFIPLLINNTAFDPKLRIEKTIGTNKIVDDIGLPLRLAAAEALVVFATHMYSVLDVDAVANAAEVMLTDKELEMNRQAYYLFGALISNGHEDVVARHIEAIADKFTKLFTEKEEKEQKKKLNDADDKHNMNIQLNAILLFSIQLSKSQKVVSEPAFIEKIQKYLDKPEISERIVLLKN